MPTARDSGPRIDRVKQDLIDAHLNPRPLFPARFPAKVSDKFADLYLDHNMFTVSFHDRADRSGFDLLVTYSRLGRSALGEYKRMVRMQGHKFHRVRVDGTRAIYARSDITFFYAWRAQGRTYIVDSHYIGGVKRRDLRTLVASSRPLPR